VRRWTKSSAEICAPICLAILLAAVMVYPLFLETDNADIEGFLVPWYDYILLHGRFAAFADNFSNYTPPYLYLLSIGTLADGWLTPLVTIKLLAIAGSVFLVCCSHVLLRQFMRPWPALVAALLILLLPSVVINSVVWGQCDALYTGFIILAVAFALQRRDLLAAAMFGAAIAFKLQAVFVAPFGLFLLLSRVIRPWSLIFSFAAWCLLMLPAWIAGRPMMDLVRIYLEQADYYQSLSLNAPNIWTYLDYFGLQPNDTATIFGIAVAALVVLAIAIIADIRKMTSRFDLLLIALLSSLAVPYILPRMHERYFFMADILSVLLACSFLSVPTVVVALLIGLGSLLASMGFLLGFSTGPAIGGLFVTVALILVALWFIVRAFPQSARWIPAAWCPSDIEGAQSPTGA
jgi:Gpi18-like mannosyltransferase